MLWVNGVGKKVERMSVVEDVGLEYGVNIVRKNVEMGVGLG